jgi:hypothetical protein
MKRKLVLANNRTQFRDWLRENKFNTGDYYCAMTPEQLVGFKDVEIIKLPGWELNKPPEFFDFLCRFHHQIGPDGKTYPADWDFEKYGVWR